MLNKNAINIAKKIVTPLVIILTAYFFGRTLNSNWNKLEGISLAPDLYVSLAVICLVLSVVLSGLLWGDLLQKLSSKPVKTDDSIRIHCASWILKYVPGQVGSVLNKLAWGKKHGHSKKAVMNSFIYENVLMIVAGLILSAPVALIFHERIGSNLSVLLPLLVAVPMLLVVYRPTFYRILNAAFTFLKKKPFTEADFLETKDILRYLIGYLLPRLLTGIAFVLIAKSFTEITPDMYVGISAAYILAGIMGILAIFVPSGLGVREAIIVLLVGQYIGAEKAIVLALLARFYATIADIGVFLIYIILNKGRVKQR